MPGLGVRNFGTEVLTSANVNGYLMQQSVMVFTDAATRTAQFTAQGVTVSAGMMAYLTATSELQVYNGSSWVKVPTADDEAYAYLYHNSVVTFAANAHTKIPWSVITNNKNISLSGGSIVFGRTGVYEINVGMRLGSGNDIWTGVNLFNASTSSILAYGYGTGNVVNDPGPVSWQFLANVTSTSNAHDVRIYRAGGTLATAVPDGNAGWTYTCTVKRLSS